MSEVISRLSYPVFLYLVFTFFFIASIFSFIVGLALLLRNPMMLRSFGFLNRSISVRKMMRPISTPHYIEPMLLKRPFMLGTFLIVGATLSILLLMNAEARIFLSLFEGYLSYFTIAGVAKYLKLFLITGNAFCVLVGILILSSPQLLSAIEAYTDRWYSVRRSALPLAKTHMEVDDWVMKHPTISGTTLIFLSLNDGVIMFAHLSSV